MSLLLDAWLDEVEALLRAAVSLPAGALGIQRGYGDGENLPKGSYPHVFLWGLRVGSEDLPHQGRRLTPEITGHLWLATGAYDAMLVHLDALYAQMELAPIPAFTLAMDDNTDWTATACVLADEGVISAPGSTNSMKSTADGAAQASFVHSITAADWTGRDFSFWVYLTDLDPVAATAGVDVLIGDTGLGNSAEWAFGTTHGFRANTWQRISFNLDSTPRNTFGTGLDQSAVEDIKIIYNHKGTPAGGNVAYWDAIEVSGVTQGLSLEINAVSDDLSDRDFRVAEFTISGVLDL